MLGNQVKQTLHAFPRILVRMASQKPKKPNNNYFDLNSITKEVDITYKTGRNLEKEVTLRARYVDAGNNVSPRATVVGLAGSPGSHNCYKYMKDLLDEKNLRLLCFNWPGSEFVPGGLVDGFTNLERNSFATAMMEKLNVQQSNRIIMMGHSRGSENALGLTSDLSTKKWPIIGVVLLNSPGFEPHKGVRVRMKLINSIAFLVQLNNRIINMFLYPTLDFFYNKMVGLRVPNGKAAATAILPMTTFLFEKQKELIEDLKRKPGIRVFFGYGAKDFLVDEFISRDFAKAFVDDDKCHYVIHDKKESEEVIVQAKQSYLSGSRYVTANFTEEGHFLQRHYPEFLIEILDAMVQADESGREKS